MSFLQLRVDGRRIHMASKGWLMHVTLAWDLKVLHGSQMLESVLVLDQATALTDKWNIPKATCFLLGKFHVGSQNLSIIQRKSKNGRSIQTS